jgi:hypothetical protein
MILNTNEKNLKKEFENYIKIKYGKPIKSTDKQIKAAAEILKNLSLLNIKN